MQRRRAFPEDKQRPGLCFGACEPVLEFENLSSGKIARIRCRFGRYIGAADAYWSRKASSRFAVLVFHAPREGGRYCRFSRPLPATVKGLHRPMLFNRPIAIMLTISEDPP